MPIKETYEKALRRAAESAPYYQLLQITLEQIDTGFARFRMPFRKELTQAYGVVHGGAIATSADTAVAFAVMTLIQPGEKVTTAEFKINFFSAVTNGGDVRRRPGRLYGETAGRGRHGGQKRKRKTHRQGHRHLCHPREPQKGE